MQSKFEYQDRVEFAKSEMLAFADRTGLSDRHATPERYLWTDAFAVCNFFELSRLTGDEKFQYLALSLIDQVHQVLGKFHPEDPRQGWISGLSDEEAQAHPLAGGLRIGKPMIERASDEPLNPRDEWDRDGQYFHYLTKWMHALHQATRHTGDAAYIHWALELAHIAHSLFVYNPGDGQAVSMHWKMSTDLSRPLVPSMGQHDPLDALVTYRELSLSKWTAERRNDEPLLDSELAEIATICAGKNWTTDDALGIGGLLFDAYRVAQLCSLHEAPMEHELKSILHSAFDGLTVFNQMNHLDAPLQFRLPFRELGLAIGLHAIDETKALLDRHWRRLVGGRTLSDYVDQFQDFYSLSEDIENVWRQALNRQCPSWVDHQNINAVMLVTSLIPDGFLSLSERNRTPTDIAKPQREVRR